MSGRTRIGGAPRPEFKTFSAVAVTVGIVVGIGIFRLPPLVAEHSSTPVQFMAFWVAGGAISLLGALCYAELAASRPHTGGEYHYLSRAFGPAVGFIFSWGRMTVIQTGSIALIAFILGDYATLVLDLGAYSASIYAASAVVLLTAFNLLGTGHSRRLQNGITASIVLILVSLSVWGLATVPSELSSGADTVPAGSGQGGAAGMAMIFVLLTYGGWNEASYLTGELYNVKRTIVRVLIAGISLITALYILVNYTYLHVLGWEMLRNAETVGSDLTGVLLGSAGAFVVALIVAMAALSTANATIITGARTNYALGTDFKMLSFLGTWNPRTNAPSNALLVQGAIALLLVGLGTWSQEAVSTMVDYTAPVFWSFLTLITLALFVFRRRDNGGERSYRVPLYPLTPILFLAACVFMLYSSLAFTGLGALIGVSILLAGVPIYVLASAKERDIPSNR
jgi:basic amino acid/polyamine antiporter, APA family